MIHFFFFLLLSNSLIWTLGSLLISSIFNKCKLNKLLIGLFLSIIYALRLKNYLMKLFDKFTKVK